MSVPRNIKRDHILKAIEKIDKEGAPNNATSKFYDLVHNGKTYPPKLVISYANIFANKEELDRNSFVTDPVFKLLEKEGFQIVEKIKIPKVKLYDIHGESATGNADRLFSADEKWFYWDDGNFKKYKKGDIVFWINRKSRKALFTIVDEVNIRPEFEDGKNFIRENGIEVYAYAQDATSYENFYRFKVSQIALLPVDWDYADPKVFQNQLMSYILFERGVGDIEKRISKIVDLLTLFTDGYASQILIDAKEFFKEENMTKQNSILLNEILESINSSLIKEECDRLEFKYQKAIDTLSKIDEFIPSSNGLYEKILDKYNKFEGGKFIPFLESLAINSEEYNLVFLIGELISYCDSHAANKKVFNEYDDKRTLARSGVRQNAWLKSLLRYKIDDNSINNLPTSIKNAISYLIDPSKGSTILSERHRVIFCNTFLNGKEFNEDEFVSDYLAFFEPYGISPLVVNTLNYTQILDKILYGFQNVRNLWIDSHKISNKSLELNNEFQLFQSFQRDAKEVGLIFPNQLVQRYIASLYTKPFVILTGLSGSGKTKLAQSFAKWLCSDDSQYLIVPVGADWTNREPLLGYPNSLMPNEYVIPESGVLNLIIKAIEDYETNKKSEDGKENILNCRPYFLILDEMNLSHVERYFADFLSTMESGDEIKLYSGASRTANNGQLIPGLIKLPPNLFIIGTVNIDETTYMFSPKVLDRANTIEFRIIESELEEFMTTNKVLKLDEISNYGTETFEDEFISCSFQKLNQLSDDIKITLINFFNILKQAGAEFGYRTTSEIARLIYNLDYFGSDINESIDIAIMQKLLPKLHGSRSKMIKILPLLLGLCYDQIEGEPKFILDSSLEVDFNKPSSIKYKLSFEKISRMYKNAIENGFTSFAEA